MLKFLSAALLLALVNFFHPTAARAVPIEVYFSGTFGQLTAAGCFICGPYTATISFDTANGFFEQTGPSSGHFLTPTFDNGTIHAQFSNGLSISSDGGGDFIDWGPGFLSTNIGSGFFHLSINAGTFNYIQYGTCGSRCAYVGVEDVTASPVPGPITGSGLPGLLISIAGFIAWRCTRRPGYE